MVAQALRIAFTDMIDVTGLLFPVFYILTTLAAAAYRRCQRRPNLGPLATRRQIHRLKGHFAAYRRSKRAWKNRR